MSNMAIVLTGRDRKIVWVNREFTEMTGYTLAEVKGRSPGSVLQGSDTSEAAVARIREKLDQEITFRDRILNYRKNGEAYMCELIVHPVFNNKNELINFLALEFDGGPQECCQLDELPKINSKYLNSSLSGTQEITMYQTLLSLLREDPLHLDPNLTIKNVADKLHTNTKYLSQVINKCAGCNFTSFINQHRIQHFGEMIMEGKHENLSIFGMAQASGFKSKSTFYAAFRKIHGISPKEFLQMHIFAQA